MGSGEGRDLGAELERRLQVMNLLDHRDKDIALITKGQLEGKQSHLEMEHVQEEGFWQYMNLLYWKPTELFDGDSGVLDLNSVKKNISHVLNAGGSFTIFEKSTKCKSETCIDRYRSPSVRNVANDREEEASVLTANIIDKIAKVKLKEPVFITEVQLEPKEAAITVEDGTSNVKVQLNCLKNPVRKLPPIPRHRENVASTTPLTPPIPQSLSSPRPQVAHSLPTFINQFSDTEWFQRCFNSIDLMNLPTAQTPGGFLALLLQLLVTADYSSKTDLVNAIQKLYFQEKQGSLTEICNRLYAVLNAEIPPNCKVDEQRAFIQTTLQTLLTFGFRSKELLTEFMVQFLQADDNFRKVVWTMLNQAGLRDPHAYFAKEMISWNLWSRDDFTKQDLQRICMAWVDRCIMHFQGTRLPNTPVVLGTSQEFYVSMETVNLYCAAQLEKELLFASDVTPCLAYAQIMKNTVLVLPKIKSSRALVRLGETQVRSRQCHSEAHLPSLAHKKQLKDCLPFIGLPICRYNLQPFSSTASISEHQQVTLRNSRKYFIINHSYV
uniref:WD repeat-containing protein 97 isoform X4 n=1 Tax=Petromyzon marinus TaxID=7757 RepID=A0AAJ7WYG4_PETMA|nr:WD repeat-containing protein 97 isoform X4 [Petromyzon marinus]